MNIRTGAQTNIGCVHQAAQVPKVWATRERCFDLDDIESVAKPNQYLGKRYFDFAAARPGCCRVLGLTSWVYSQGVRFLTSFEMTHQTCCA
jgi:hypothetical protein